MATKLKIGSGFISYKMIPGHGLRIGGMDIPAEYSLSGPYDTDVLCHAVAEALLGAAGMGGIRDFYPDKGKVDSWQNLKEIEKIYYFEKLKIVNLDISIQGRADIIFGFRDKLKQNIQTALFLKPGQINIKINDGFEPENDNYTTVHTVVLVKSK